MGKNRSSGKAPVFATDYSRVNFDIESMKMTCTSFARKFDVLKSYRSSGVCPAQKLRVVRSNLVIEDRYGEGFRRWWSGDSREDLCRYLKQEFNDYSLFLSMVSMALNHDRLNPDLVSIKDRCVSLCESVCPALHSLTFLYPEYEMLTSCLTLATNNLNMFVQKHSDEPYAPVRSIQQLLISR